MHIKLDKITGPEILALLKQHLDSMREHSPPESVHALDVSGLQQPDVSFWTVWEDGELLGCGALKTLDEHHGEIKSMRTATAHLRKGVARFIMNRIIEEAKRNKIRRLSLETGSMEVFEPARRLYSDYGFTFCEPFADYQLDPYSVFMTREL